VRVDPGEGGSAEDVVCTKGAGALSPPVLDALVREGRKGGGTRTRKRWRSKRGGRNIKRTQ
jgi:hypothetical protein